VRERAWACVSVREREVREREVREREVREREARALAWGVYTVAII